MRADRGERKPAKADLDFAAGLAALLDGELVGASMLGDEALLVRLAGGRQLVAKRVARQSQGTWRPGKPWAELVALDALSARGAPVPRIVAADLGHGWLALEYVPGVGLQEVCEAGAPPATTRLAAFVSLVNALEQLEHAFAAEWEHLSPWATPVADDHRQLAAGLAPLLDHGARDAWNELAALAIQRGAVHPGPLDVQPGNVIWGERPSRVTFVDMASFGHDVTEKRLVAYAQKAGPGPRSLLDHLAYGEYERLKGREAALRLAFFDLLYWGMALARLLAAQRAPGSVAAERVREVWGDPEALIAPFAAMWRRERLDDPRIERVQHGLAAV